MSGLIRFGWCQITNYRPLQQVTKQLRSMLQKRYTILHCIIRKNEKWNCIPKIITLWLHCRFLYHSHSFLLSEARRPKYTSSREAEQTYDQRVLLPELHGRSRAPVSALPVWRRPSRYRSSNEHYRTCLQTLNP